jgi:hypothetical protein
MTAKKRSKSGNKRKTPRQNAALCKLRIRGELSDMTNHQLLMTLNAARRVKREYV